MICYYEIPKSYSNKRKAECLNSRPLVKPDLSNIVKGIEDALNGIAYIDDCQIVDLHVMKFYSDEPRVEVVLEEI